MNLHGQSQYHLPPLNEKLVQAGRDTLIGLNPIMSKYQVITTLHLRDEEGYGQSFAPDGELHQCNSFGRNRLASFTTTDHHVGFDHLIIHATKLLLN
jgi:hypothetical protein